MGHPAYAGINVDELDTPDERAALQRLPETVNAAAEITSDETALALQAVATADVAGIREARDPGATSATSAPEAAAGGNADVASDLGVTAEQQRDGPGVPTLRALGYSMVVSRNGGLRGGSDVHTVAVRAVRVLMAAEEQTAGGGNGGGAGDGGDGGDAVDVDVPAEHAASAPLSEFQNNRAALAGAFPSTFPTGKVAPKEGTLHPDVVLHLLMQFTGVPAQNPRLLLMLADQLRRHAAAVAVAARVDSTPEAVDVFTKARESPEFRAKLERAAEELPADATPALQRAHQKLQREVLAPLAHVLSFSSSRVPFHPAQQRMGVSQL